MGRELFEDHNPFVEKLITNDAFVPLIRSVMRDTHVTHHDLARLIGIRRASLTRYLSNQRPLCETVVQSIFLALGINRSRAYIAVIELGDWQRYSDPNVVLVADLVQVFIPELARERGYVVVEKLSIGAIRNISRQLTAAVVKNDQETAERRDTLMLGDLRN